jgi:hypothetical protein
MSPTHFLWEVTSSTLSAMHLHVALVELGLELRDRAELGGAHRREVLGMREEDAPRFAEPLVEVDGAFGRVLGEVGGDVAELDGHDGVTPGVRSTG